MSCENVICMMQNFKNGLKCAEMLFLALSPIISAVEKITQPRYLMSWKPCLVCFLVVFFLVLLNCLSDTYCTQYCCAVDPSRQRSFQVSFRCWSVCVCVWEGAGIVNCHLFLQPNASMLKTRGLILRMLHQKICKFTYLLSLMTAQNLCAYLSKSG